MDPFNGWRPYLNLYLDTNFLFSSLCSGHAMFRGNLHAISNENSPFLFSLRSRIIWRHRAPTHAAIHTLASMSSAAAADDAPEEFAALADYAVDDFMSEAASDVEVFATTEGHGDQTAT